MGVSVVKHGFYGRDGKEYTCNRSSKSRAANFFISDALLDQPRMVDPKLKI